MRSYKATRFQRFMGDVRFARYAVPDILAGIALAALIVLLPIFAAML